MTTRLLSVPAVAALLDCSRTHVYGLIAAGHLRPVDIAAKPRTRPKTRIRATDVDAYIERQTREVRAS